MVRSPAENQSTLRNKAYQNTPHRPACSESISRPLRSGGNKYSSLHQLLWDKDIFRLSWPPTPSSSDLFTLFHAILAKGISIHTAIEVLPELNYNYHSHSAPTQLAVSLSHENESNKFFLPLFSPVWPRISKVFTAGSKKTSCIFNCILVCQSR